jgi:metal-sulfur cluster biosynthetic enzyme
MSDNPNLNRPEWAIDATHPDLVESLTEALREIVDPEINLNIIQLGLIRNVTVDDNSAVVKMMLTTPFCPYGPAMLESTRQKAEGVLKVSTHMDLSMDMWDFSMMEEGLADGWGLY